MRSLVAALFGFILMAGGLLLLAFSQVSNAVPDANRSEASGLRQFTVVNEAAGGIGSALLFTAGILVLLATHTRVRGWRRAAALAVVGASLTVFLVTHTLLLVNGASYGAGDARAVTFKASYFFHATDDVTFAAVYILFFFTVFLLALIVGAVGYLLFPQRFGQAVAARNEWARNEASHVVTTLFLVANLLVLVLYLARVASATDGTALARAGLMGDLLVPLYYLTALLLGVLALSVAAHAFLLNWGHNFGLERPNLAEALRTIARAERGLVAGSAVLAFLILLGPELPTRVALSRTFVFNVSPRGLAYATFLFLTPYVPYAVTQWRLERLLARGLAPRPAAPFSDRSLRVVTYHLLGAALVLSLATAARWNALGVMIALSLWTAGVFLANAVRWETQGLLPRLSFRGAEGPAFYVAFLVLALTTGLMLWGAGNTYEAEYWPATDALRQTNESEYGASILARIAATVLVAGCLVLTLDLLRHTMGVRGRFLPHYIAMFLTSVVGAYALFSVGIWNTESGGVRDAYTGFNFHRYYAGEKILAATFLVLATGYLQWALGRVLRPMLETGRAATTVETIQVRW